MVKSFFHPGILGLSQNLIKHKFQDKNDLTAKLLRLPIKKIMMRFDKKTNKPNFMALLHGDLFTPNIMYNKIKNLFCLYNFE